MIRPIYFDIDGTLTNEPTRQWGRVFPNRIKLVRDLVESGQEVVIWSGGGTKYAKEFAEKYGLAGAVCIGKPEYIVDDNPDIRPKGRMPITLANIYFGDKCQPPLT